MADSRREKIEKLAGEVMHLSRNTLMVQLRFMDAAISSLRLTSDPDTETILTDGEQIRYNPEFVLRSYKQDKNLVTRQYLHMILHCVFLHAFAEEMSSPMCWNLACDIAAENVINELNLPQVMTAVAKAQLTEIKNLKQNVKYMTAEVLYRYFLDEGVSEDEKNRLQELFRQDRHESWYLKESGHKKETATQEMSGENPGEGAESVSYIEKEQQSETDRENFSEMPDSSQPEEKENENCRQTIYTKKQNGRKSRQTGEKTTSFDKQKNPQMGTSKKDVRNMWKDISHQMQLDLETFSKERGDRSGSLTQNLMAVNRETYDYSSFLKKFASSGEAMRINDDEFDYIFYTYGLQMYGKMPLVEPLEYKEVKKIKDFVIALDTSGSTSESLVQKFVQKTYNILKQQENFFSRINLHIIQCDAEIQEDVKITSQEEFDAYLEHMQIHGLSGTDFRPVFSHVDYLLESHEFTNLKGLIYFTDGFGVFPKKQPPYKTAFVYLDEGYENPQVPVWAMKLVLRADEI